MCCRNRLDPREQSWARSWGNHREAVILGPCKEGLPLLELPETKGLFFEVVSYLSLEVFKQKLNEFLPRGFIGDGEA